MQTKTLKTIPKTSVKIWRPIIDKLDAKLEATCLRRDAYLNKVLEIELTWLDHEVAIPNSQSGYDHVFERLDCLDRKLVSLAISPALTSRLNEICNRKRIVRDAFFNRLFLLLASAPKTIDRLFFSGDGSEWRNYLWAENKHNADFFQNSLYPLGTTVDPFWAIRSVLEMYAESNGLKDYVEPISGSMIRVQADALTDTIELPDGVYTTIFNQKVKENDLRGLNCYMPDWAVPGHSAQLAQSAMLDELLGAL